MDEKYKRAYVGELYFLQKQINALQKANEIDPEPTVLEAVDILKRSQDKLYGTLVYHGVTAEEVRRVIMENNDKELVKEVLSLQKSKSVVTKQLSNSNLLPEKRQLLEYRLNLISEEYVAKWGEVKQSSNRNELISQVEQAQIKDLQRTLQKSREQDKDREAERSR
jgi:hypothetical protein